ncbi:hypothetical protein [Streptomyces chrestomyceticus]|uniref:hypothetical protein n=1 Tax=Streptomyces chrestomyceticus TaxID=68185 RepID=UPI0004C6B56F
MAPTPDPGAGRRARPVAGRRARDLLAEGCRATRARTALVPALYCPDVVAALGRAGLAVRYYDVAPGLGPPGAEAERELDDRSVLVWHHPFGCFQQPPAHAGVPVVEDACVALRTAVVQGLDHGDTELRVFSLRKEFAQPIGGVAFGRRAPALAPRLSPADREAADVWRKVRTRLRRSAEAGQAATRIAREHLGVRLSPATVSTPVLTQLPLVSAERDRVVRTLRDRGIAAWFWQERVPGAGNSTAPMAWELWRRLFLVPLPTEQTALQACLGELARVRLDPW